MTVRPRSTLLAMTLAAVLAAGVAAALQVSGAFSSLEQESVSARFALRDTPRPQGIVVVAIDDVTFSDLRRPWPFPRSLHGKAVDQLRRAGAKQIVYDVQFTEPTTEREDLSLYDALGRARGSVLGTTETDGHGHTAILGGDANLRQIAAHPAASNVGAGAGSLVSRLPYEVGGLRTLGVVAAAGAGGPALARAEFGRRGALIDYRGPGGTFPTISFSDVVAHRFDAKAVRGKIVVIGASVPTLHDLHSTAVAPDRLMSGPEVQANAIWTALHGLPLRAAPGWLGILLLVLLAGAAPAATLLLGVLRAALVSVVLAAMYAVAAQLIFGAGVVLDVVAPLAALALGAVAAVAASHIGASRERDRAAEREEVLERMVQERTLELHRTQLEVISRLAHATESRDEETGRHVARMSTLAHRLGLALGLGAEQAGLLRSAAPLHDIGKIGIPDRILLKPGPLDPDEWKIMKTHTTLGAEILAGSDSPLVQMAETIALTHHERWDGGGYPQGLAGEEIPLVGRICAVCDVFDALTSERPYKAAWSVDSALEEIRSERGRQFDPRVVAAFLELVPATGPHASSLEPAGR
jgi:response regulator RpfG family c-di-GMP phosphodiesterase